MKRLFSYLRPFAGRMSIGLAIKIAGTLVELALPYILGMILNDIIKNYALIFFEIVGNIADFG